MFQVGSLPNRTTMQYIDEALELSRKINYHKGIGNALLNKGIEVSLNEHYNKSVHLFLALKEYTIGIFPSIPFICHLPVSVSTEFLKLEYGE